MVGGLAGHSPKVPQLYQVACVAGHRLRGERTEGYQALRCPTCGEGIFVLPRSPLPEAAAPETPRPAARASEIEAAWPEDDVIPLSDPAPSTSSSLDESEVDGEIEWIDRVAEAEAELEPPKPEAVQADARDRNAEFPDDL